MSTAHSLDPFEPDLSINDTPIKRVSSLNLLGTHIDQHLCWEENMKQVLSSCYATLAVLRKLKNILPFNIRKTLVQASVLSKLYFSGIVYHNVPDCLPWLWLVVFKECKKLQQVSFWDILWVPTTSLSFAGENRRFCSLHRRWGTFREEERLRLNHRNSILMT